MKDPELNDLLRAAQVPERKTEYWEQFPEDVRRAVRRPQSATTAVPEKHPRWLAWGIGLATACLAIGFFVGKFHQAEPHGQSLAESVKLIQEVAALFPNRVQAIISDENGVRLVLSEKADIPTSTPLYVKVCDGKKCVSAVTFSGQQLQMGGQTFEVLADARGHVLLVGDQLVWNSAESVKLANHLKIEAKPLDVTL